MMRRRRETGLRRHSVAGTSELSRSQASSLYQSLLRAGFPGDLIRAEMRRHGDPSAELPEEGHEEE